MTDRDAFNAALDADPGNQSLRSVYADWLEEHAEIDDDLILAAGMRWMVAKGKYPSNCHGDFRSLTKWKWFWFQTILSDNYTHAVLSDFIDLCDNHATMDRQEAEMNLAKALLNGGLIKIDGVK